MQINELVNLKPIKKTIKIDVIKRSKIKTK